MARAARGPHPQRLHPRGRRGHRRRAAHRHLPLSRRATPRSSPSFHERRRASSACSRWTSSACATWTSSIARSRSSSSRPGTRLDMDALPLDDAQDLRDAGPRRRDGRVPVRVVGHARRPAGVKPDRVRRPDRAERALPARADGVHPRYATNKGDPAGSRYEDERLRPMLEPTLRRRHLPGAVHGDREGRGRVQPGAGRRPAQGHRQEDPELMATLKEPFMEGAPRTAPEAVAEQAVGQLRGRRRLRLQQVPRRLLRAHRLPHRLPERELPGRVHGRTDLERHGHQGQGARSTSPSATRWASRCCHRTSTTSRSDFTVVERQDPLRALCGQAGRRRRGAGDHRRPRRAPDRVDLGLLRAGRCRRS